MRTRCSRTRAAATTTSVRARPCIDAGTNDAPNLPAFDFEGDPRIIDGNEDGKAIVDMGVDELLWQRLYLPLVVRSYRAETAPVGPAHTPVPIAPRTG